MQNSHQRIIYIDLIRVMAIFLVIFHHINFHLIDSKLFSAEQLWSNYIANVSFGDLGVSLFLLISGLGLTLSLEGKKLNLLSFYKKRVQRIYPMFWIIFLFFSIWYWYKQYLQLPIDIKYFLLSLTGLDTYIVSFFKIKTYSYYDWFIGFIIIFYLIYPILHKIYTKNLKLLIFISIILIPSSVIVLGSELNFRFIPLRLLEFCLGMWYSKVLTRNYKPHFIILTIVSILLAAITLIRFPVPVQFNVYIFFAKLISLDFVVIELIYFLCSLFQSQNRIGQLINYLATILYAMFLLQHQIIIRFIYDFVYVHKTFIFTKTISPLIFITISMIISIIVLSMLFSKIESLLLKKLART